MFKYLLTLILFCTSIMANAQEYKINLKERLRPYEIKIEKVKVQVTETVIFLKIKQQERFSYSISFADCAVFTPSNPTGVKGKLNSWNEDKKIHQDIKTINDEDWEEFTLSFPTHEFISAPYFDLKIGTVQDRKKTELTVLNIRIKKK